MTIFEIVTAILADKNKDAASLVGRRVTSRQYDWMTGKVVQVDETGTLARVEWGDPHETPCLVGWEKISDLI